MTPASCPRRPAGLLPPGPRRIRQRSNSDITISELDAGSDGAEDWGSPGAKWSPVHREYGSTSSIDKHGPSGESFFDMLKGYQGDKPDQRSPAPDRLGDLLTISHKQAGFDLPDGPVAGRRGSPSARLKEREKPLKRRSKSETGGDSIFRKLRTARTEGDSSRAGSDAEDGRRQTSAKLRNTTTGASAAAAASASSSLSSTHSAPYSSPCGSQEELSAKDGVGLDAGDDKSNELVLSCPCFRNEVGGEGERKISLTHCTNNGVAVLEVPKDSQGVHMDRGKRYIVEHVDLGSYYYRKYFYLREHWNYFGVDETLGPVAVSLRREKLEDHKDHGPQYNYRVIFRTSELTTLRGSILEDGVPSTSKHGTARGLPLKEVLEYLVPELNAHCLRLALNTPKVTEQLMKLDEQGLSFQLKVGVMYCQAGQSSEEEMYNNEAAGPAMEEFLQLLGERVRLKGFTKYRAQLDTKTDSTGTHSLYTTYKDYEIMFHVSTMLPYTPNNKQQLLRKRHIGNDIVTIVFQEPGAQPFTPKNIRSHFQHVFVIVRAHSPCSDSTCYSVAVARSRDVPSFGPPIPKGVTFPKSTVFRDFLLAKVINAENAAHKSEKFRAMATRTRQEYLRDLAERHVTSTPIDPSGKFPFISLAHKRKEKSRPYGGAELRSLGAVTWPVHVEDHGAGAELEGLLAVSNELLVLIDREAKAVVFNCSVRDVIGWTLGSPASMKIFYERGECVSLRSVNNNTEDFRDIVKRLELLTKGCETTEMTAAAERPGPAGLPRQLRGHRGGGGAVRLRLAGGCARAAGWWRSARVVIIPPHEDSTPRRGCSELFRLPVVEYKGAADGGHGGGPGRAVSLGASVGKAPPSERAAAIPRSVSSDGRPLDNRRFSPGSDNYALASSVVMGRSAHNRNSPSMLSYSDVGPAGPAHWRQKSVPEGFGVNRNSPLPVDRQSAGEGGGSSSGKSTPNRPRAEEGGGAGGGPDRTPAEPQVAKPAVAQPSVPRIQRQEQVIHLSPNKNSQTETPYSSHSSSNTLSSNASSGAHSDEKWYEIGAGRASGPTRRSTARGEVAPAPDSSPSRRERRGPARSPPTYPLPRDGSSYSLSDAASHTSTLSSRHSGSPVVLGSSRNSPREESPSATSPTSQTSLSPGPKSFYPRQGATSKYLIGWRKPGSTINSVGFGETRKRHQSDGPEVRQPQLKATMRDLQSPQRLTKSTVEEDLKKLIALDSPPPTSKEHKPSFSSSAPSRRSLHRTLSDESIYSGQRDPSFRMEPALPSEALFSCSTVPRSPTVRGVALRRPPYALGAKLHGDLSASETSLSELQDRQRQPLQDPGLMPLPDTDADSGLDWCHLVDAAKAFEDQRASLLAAKDVNHRPESTDSNSQHAEPQATPQPRPSLGEVPAGLLGKVSQLESMVRLLQEDLQKEKEDKAVLQAQIQSLREDNQRLQEESQNASAKLKKFTEWVFNTIDMN
ncbi:hypothetical protein ANANG_G00021110 [Anguilla anguilla]|uniref:Rap-GAP domain-containing protein n=1 Tax=Anguilla anguilla TaxID=7936 RepID=A0A9D3S783_ANGAN|nr:hypothetical protein ANANG_G00021110 [Anguilla anguilla]